MSDPTLEIGLFVLGPVLTAGYVALWRMIRRRRIVTGEPLTAEEARTRWEAAVLALTVLAFLLFFVGLVSGVTVVWVSAVSGLSPYGTPFWITMGVYYTGIALAWVITPYSQIASPALIRQGMAMLAPPEPPPVPEGALGRNGTSEDSARESRIR